MDDSEVKTLLVVGGTGFIGSHVVMAALSRGWDVTVTVYSQPPPDFFPGTVEYVAIAHDDPYHPYKYLRGRKFTYVVDLGGYVDHAEFNDGGMAVMHAHYLGLLNLLDVIDRHSVKCFVHAGSSDEYGSMPAPQSESFREAPASPYAAAKVSATHFLQMLYRAENFPAVILRIFIAYGPGQKVERLIPYAINQSLLAETIEVSSGAQIRDFCYITDVVDAIFACFFAMEARGLVINIGSGAQYSVKQVVEKIVSLVGSGLPKFGNIPMRDGEPIARVADISLARRVLNWGPRISLDEGLKLTIEAHQKSSLI